MTDKPALMSREEIEERLAHCMSLKEMGLDEGCPLDLSQLEPLLRAALAAHDIYDKAIEDAAQIAEQTVVSKPVWGTQEPATHSKPKTPSLTRMVIAEQIRQLKGTSNG